MFSPFCKRCESSDLRFHYLEDGLHVSCTCGWEVVREHRLSRLEKNVADRYETHQEERHQQELRKAEAEQEAKRTGKRVVARHVRGSRPGMFYGYSLGSTPFGYGGDIFNTVEWGERIETYAIYYDLE